MRAVSVALETAKRAAEVRRSQTPRTALADMIERVCWGDAPLRCQDKSRLAEKRCSPRRPSLWCTVCRARGPCRHFTNELYGRPTPTATASMELRGRASSQPSDLHSARAQLASVSPFWPPVLDDCLIETPPFDDVFPVPRSRPASVGKTMTGDWLRATQPGWQQRARAGPAAQSSGAEGFLEDKMPEELTYDNMAQRLLKSPRQPSGMEVQLLAVLRFPMCDEYALNGSNYQASQVGVPTLGACTVAGEATGACLLSGRRHINEVFCPAALPPLRAACGEGQTDTGGSGCFWPELS